MSGTIPRHILRLTAFILIPALLLSQTVYAAKRPLEPAQAKAKLTERGVGHGVRVVLADQSQVNGVISRLGDEDFVILPRNHAEAQTISYTQVAEVHRARFSRGQKVAIGTGIFVGAAVAIFAIGHAAYHTGRAL